MNKEKVLFVVADITYIGGIERVVTSLTNNLDSKKYDITILSLYKTNSKCNYKINANVSIDYLDEYDSYSGEPGSFVRVAKLLKKIKLLKSYLRNHVYDTVVANSFPIALALILSRCKSNLVAYEHVHYNYYSNTIKYLRKKCYNSVDEIVCLTESDRENYSKWHNNVRRIYNPLWLKSHDSSNLYNKRIIAVGRLEHQKGFDDLITLFSEIKVPGWKLDIYGVGNQKNELEKLITNLGIDNIKLCGETDNIVGEYLTSDILVMTSRFEGFGMVLIEAMECGLPCIAFDCPTGPSDIIMDSENGYLIPDRSFSEYRSKLRSVMLDHSLRERLGKNAKLSTSKFNMSSITKTWEKVLSKVIV